MGPAIGKVVQELSIAKKECQNILGAIVGLSLILALVFIPVLTTVSAEGHQIMAFTDINGDKELDIILRDDRILLSRGDRTYVSNEVVFKERVPMQRSYSFLNGTATAIDNQNAFINISYLKEYQTDGQDSIFLMNPGNMTVTIFTEDSDGDFRPDKTLTLKDDMARNLIYHSNTSFARE